jgi:orotidine-5'-phosphate decarboxylase
LPDSVPAADRVIVALDGMDGDQALAFTAMVPELRWVKVGLELFVTAGPAVVARLRERGLRVFLDLKFHDIPATVAGAVRSARAEGVDFLTVHADAGRVALERAAAEAGSELRVLAVTLLTSMNREELTAAGYRFGAGEEVSELVGRRAKLAQRAGCRGVICAGGDIAAIKQRCGPHFLVVVPGVRPAWTLFAGDDQRRVTTPRDAVRAGADYLVIGRPVRLAPDPRAALMRVVEEISAG